MAADHEHENAVRLYVETHPGCTAREVARDVFGGSGRTRTSDRARAHAYLSRLRERGVLSRTDHLRSDKLVEYRWEPSGA